MTESVPTRLSSPSVSGTLTGAPGAGSLPLPPVPPEMVQRYASAKPFPHLHIESFLPAELAKKAAKEFPSPTDDGWLQYKHYNERKLGKNNREQIPPTINAIFDQLLSDRFVRWLEVLTGISGLHADPSLDGGGLHQTERDGFLRIHTDFSHHHQHRNWRRRINLIVYLTEGWQEEWGGHLELWDSRERRCVAKYAPSWNHAVIFTTSDISLHGHPHPLCCPAGVTRKSLALYYYTEEDSKHPATPYKSTHYIPDPKDGVRSILVHADNLLLKSYSFAKRWLGFDDQWVSRVLGWLSRKR